MNTIIKNQCITTVHLSMIKLQRLFFILFYCFWGCFDELKVRACWECSMSGTEKRLYFEVDE